MAVPERPLPCVRAGILRLDNGVPTDAAVLLLMAKVAAQPLGAKQLLHMGAAIMLGELKQQRAAELHPLIDSAMTSMLTAPQMVSTVSAPVPVQLPRFQRPRQKAGRHDASCRLTHAHTRTCPQLHMRPNGSVPCMRQTGSAFCIAGANSNAGGLGQCLSCPHGHAAAGWRHSREHIPGHRRHAHASPTCCSDYPQSSRTAGRCSHARWRHAGWGRR